ncbi:DUF3124 domain-containing protein [Aetokthonos hydrillicola Thurmond2011]|jgi:hypothetical protein|uniref:DUF3124 domain-containing protein n=1 Tax=Aetokthonos hydrillicola Thurmond2011 TaxID=2712845 RepID=A0AAP5M7K7_9CYAN|nr:DUF3124 domain-containing protein [Aetokthonos hydrillicola]MBO3457525.1 DUF3124 domain-containing protein [Aetokthonos hydrillicola CCALA 1050]MBW4585950.1 DUF3124 domain-containing protein [Aetokthonos hydrillicola CCALA 1050]MDR9893822.1 DUF3124 domain-containing protein [Aetokthonos hydrillicola Thurmond2011]
MKLNFYIAIAVMGLVSLASCKSSEIAQQSKTNTTLAIPSPKTVTLDKNFQIATGQTTYVPVYSHIYHDNKKAIFNLAVTLSIRNTDLTNPIIITSIRYYDSNGKLVKQYLKQPIQLDALASTDFFVDRDDKSGGLGANFIVEWVAQTEISEPIVQAVMIGTDFQQGISWISPGKVIKSQKREQGAGSRGVSQPAIKSLVDS